MARADRRARHQAAQRVGRLDLAFVAAKRMDARVERRVGALGRLGRERARHQRRAEQRLGLEQPGKRSEEHTSELQSLMRISYAVFCLKKKNTEQNTHTN